jgi:hypothetical protein
LDFLSEKSEALANGDLLMLPQYEANLDVNTTYYQQTPITSGSSGHVGLLCHCYYLSTNGM